MLWGDIFYGDMGAYPILKHNYLSRKRKPTCHHSCQEIQKTFALTQKNSKFDSHIPQSAISKNSKKNGIRQPDSQSLHGRLDERVDEIECAWATQIEILQHHRDMYFSKFLTKSAATARAKSKPIQSFSTRETVVTTNPTAFSF